MRQVAIAMGVRLLDDAQLSNVIPFRPRAYWSVGVDTPEPVQLYHLIVLAFLLHTSSGQPQMCASCGQKWPCDHLRLAYRLREGLAVTSAKPLVHGYIRVEWPDETEIAEMCQDISAYCRVNGYQLGKVFVDRGVCDDVFARTRFIDLLDEVRLTQARAVVVPTVDRLSSEAFVQDALKRMVEQASAEVFVVYETNGGGPVADGGRDIGSAPGASW